VPPTVQPTWPRSCERLMHKPCAKNVGRDTCEHRALKWENVNAGNWKARQQVDDYG
jgi:hypothetical protein